MSKKNLIIPLLLLGLAFSKGISQANLVPNASFEALTSCPDNEGQIFFADPWFSASTTGTPDLYNSCSSEPSLGVPYNRFGGTFYQPSRTGEGYAGILVYNHNTNTDTRENIETPLVRSLKVNKQYYIRFFVSTSNSWIINDAPCYCDGIGAAFTESKYLNNTGNLPVLSDLNPSVDNQETMLSDTVNWIPVSGCFTNTQSEKNYLIIGNFRDNGHTLASPECDLSFPNASYLYVEDVGVWEFDPLPDTVLLCMGESKTFHVSFLEASFEWSDGSTDSTLSISRGGVYSVSADMGDCVLSDTVTVIEVEGLPSLPKDTLICQGNKIALSAPMPGDCAWSTGAVSPGIEVFEAGNYALTVTNECGTFNYESRVETEVCDCPIYVPNVFSPDGDGQDDEMLVFPACDFPLWVERFQIFDRWGSLVYASESGSAEGVRWGGLSNGRPAAPGVYFWVMEYAVAPNGQAERKSLRGDITLLR